MRSRLRPTGTTLRQVWRSRLTWWFRERHEKFFWCTGIGAGITIILLSCSSLDSGRSILAPPSIPGAEFVGSAECATCHEEISRDFPTATHARLKAPGDNTKNVGCESCHGAGSLHVKSGGAAHTIVNPHKSPTTCFQCHLEVRAQFDLPHHHPVLEGKVSCADCHNPHKGDAIKGGGTAGFQSIKGGGTALLGQNDTCFQCHSVQRGPFVFEHEALREGCVTCHSPHGSVNQRMLTERNQALCLKCHFQQQTAPGQILIADVDHASFLPQGACWSAGCHEAVHGSQVSPALRY